MVSEETSIFFGTLFYLIEVACVSVMQPNVIYLMKVLNTYINIQLMVVSLFTPRLSGVNSLKYKNSPELLHETHIRHGL